MTDRIRGFIVTLAEDWRDDDANATIAAIAQIRGVVSVKPVVADISSIISDQRARNEYRQRLWKVLDEDAP